jgi:hypothetical protein
MRVTACSDIFGVISYYQTHDNTPLMANFR